jgi:hypothetical protein
MRALAALLALAVVACGEGGPSEAENEAFVRTLENIAQESPDENQANLQEPMPTLVPLAPGEREQALGTAPGCDFSRGDEILFAATGTSAVTKIDGRLVRLGGALAAGATGGFFAGGDYSVSIGRLVDSGVVVEGTTSWPARLLLTDRSRDGAEVRTEGAWRCPTGAG